MTAPRAVSMTATWRQCRVCDTVPLMRRIELEAMTVLRSASRGLRDVPDANRAASKM